MLLLNNKPTIAGRKSTRSTASSRMRARVAMMLSLSLCCAAWTGCKTPNRILPAIHQGPQGNSVIALLPAGTTIALPAQADMRALLPFANEVTLSNGCAVLRTPLRLITPAYLAERDAREMNLHRRISELEAKP